jgi:hypothetical protein
MFSKGHFWPVWVIQHAATPNRGLSTQCGLPLSSKQTFGTTFDVLDINLYFKILQLSPGVFSRYVRSSVTAACNSSPKPGGNQMLLTHRAYCW